MLQVMTTTARAAVIVFVGVFTFAAPWPGPGWGAAEIAAFAITVVLAVPWTIAEDFPGRATWYVRLLPAELGLISLACGVAYAGPSGGALLALCFMAALSAGRRMAPTWSWIVPALSVAGAAATGIAPRADLWVLVAYAAGLLSAALVIGIKMRTHQVEAEQAAELLAQAEALREEQAQVATLQERTRIAREIHDVLAHSLGALGLQIELIRAVLTDSDDTPHAVDLLDQAHRMTTTGLAETRRAVYALRGDTLPLPDGLAGLSVAHERQHGTPVSFEVIGEPRPLGPEAGLAIIRTAQEALVNAAKYGPDRPITMRLDYADDAVHLVVTSRLDASGAGRREPSLATVDGGYGLSGLRERLLLLRGTLSAGRRGGDWVVQATVPR